MEKDVMNKTDQSSGRVNEYNVISINIDNIPDSSPQQVDIQNVAQNTSENSGRDAPIDLDQLVIDENGYVQTVKRELRVRVDHISGDTIVSVIDGESQNVVRQVPKSEMLAVERLITAPAGMLFRAHA